MIRISFLITAGIAFLVTALSGFAIIPWLRKLKFGQTINDVGPTWHSSKQGTPTMGGIMFAIGIIVSLIFGFYFMNNEIKTFTGAMYEIEIRSLIFSVLTAFGFGAIGFVDDYIKVVKKRNLGLKARYKIIGQIAVTSLFLIAQGSIGHISTLVVLPFIGNLELGNFYYVLMFLAIIFIVNAVNLTDGIDGLCTSITFVTAVGFMMISVTYSYLTNALFACGIAGACVGFLAWNFYPAKVFMGDTGSMFLGGAVVAMAWAINRPELLLFLGMVYALEALSVVIQVSYFKITKGKRIFKMSPIHHHFEMCGWNEVKIVTVFSFVAVIFAVLGYAYMYMN